jgi:hypothetical protein
MKNGKKVVQNNSATSKTAITTKNIRKTHNTEMITSLEIITNNNNSITTSSTTKLNFY